MGKHKILITGHLGFIGKYLHSLVPNAYGIDIKDGSGDIRKRIYPKDYTHIFHLAALRSVPKGELYPKQFLETNCWGTINFARTFPNARILNISSSAAVEHSGVYGLSKFFTENIKHSNWLNCRLYNVFGYGQPLESGAIVPKIIHCLKTGTYFDLYGTGEQTRDFTYVRDVILTLKRLMFDKKQLTGLVDVAYQEPISVNSFLELWMTMTSKHLTIVQAPERKGDVLHSPDPVNPVCSQRYGRLRGIYETWKESTVGQ